MVSMGDFNEILHLEDKQGGCSVDLSIMQGNNYSTTRFVIHTTKIQDLRPKTHVYCVGTPTINQPCPLHLPFPSLFFAHKQIWATV